MIGIIGGGPRSLAIALQLASHKIPVTIFDDKPLHTWSSPYIIEDLIMRSPITFDLVTYIPQLKEYSLANFLNKDINCLTQKEIEYCKERPSRNEFYLYLQWIKDKLEDLGITFIKEKVELITPHSIKTKKSEYIFEYILDYIIIATGATTVREVKPNWLHTTLSLQQANLEQNKTIGVVGSGQGAVEIAVKLSEQNNVYWITNKKYKIEEYPVPSYKDIGYKSALGDYYRKSSFNTRQEYLKQVKQWQPSITPYIHTKLLNSNIKIITPNSTADLENIELFVLANGLNPDISKVPFDFNIKLNPINTYFPDIVSEFKSSSHSNIYFTGILASIFDGPRQGSLISAGLTAKEIVDSILNIELD